MFNTIIVDGRYLRKINVWTFEFHFGAYPPDPFRIHIFLGIYKIIEWPNEGAYINHSQYRGFMLEKKVRIPTIWIARTISKNK